jgi:signal transduction histidine kinase
LQNAALSEITTGGRRHHRRTQPAPPSRLSDESTDFADLVTTLTPDLRLETSFAGLRRFTADASHELKTPLTVLRADVERAMMESGQQTSA